MLLGVVQAATALVFGSPSRSTCGRSRRASPRSWRSASLGICSVGTLFAAIAVRTRYREVMLPLLLLPLLVPVLLGAVRARRRCCSRSRLPWEPVQLLLVTDATFLIVSFLGFEYVLDE